MIIISGIKDIDFAQYDQVWYITNNNPNMRVGAQHHQELAPPANYYYQYRQGAISLDSLLNEYGSKLWSGVYKEAIDNLIGLSESELWIQLVCYCTNYNKCHRYVLYRYLKEIYDKVVCLDIQ
jgi:uncharacterized protein YeaO (DUF488 family)